MAGTCTFNTPGQARYARLLEEWHVCLRRVELQSWILAAVLPQDSAPSSSKIQCLVLGASSTARQEEGPKEQAKIEPGWADCHRRWGITSTLGQRSRLRVHPYHRGGACQWPPANNRGVLADSAGRTSVIAIVNKCNDIFLGLVGRTPSRPDAETACQEHGVRCCTVTRAPWLFNRR